MFNPSTVRNLDEPVAKREAGGSTYVFADAYSGDYEFFEGRPIKFEKGPVVDGEKPSAGTIVISTEALQEKIRTLQDQLGVMLIDIQSVSDPVQESFAERNGAQVNGKMIAVDEAKLGKLLEIKKILDDSPFSGEQIFDTVRNSDVTEK